MTVESTKLIYDFVRKYNSQRSNTANKLKLSTVVSYINEALEIWFENRANAFEVNTEIRNALRNFEIKDKPLQPEQHTFDTFRVSIPEDLYRKTLLYVESESDCCEGVVKTIQAKFIQSDDLFKARKSTYNSSSFKWERMLCDEAGQHYYLYPEEGHKIRKVFLSYLKRPNYIQETDVCEGAEKFYEDYNEKLITKKVNLEVDNTFDHRKITDIAVLIASRDNLEPAAYESQLKKILETKNL